MVVTGVVFGRTIQLDGPTPLPDGSRVSFYIHSDESPAEWTPEERMALVEMTAGSLKASREQVEAALESDYYGVE